MFYFKTAPIPFDEIDPEQIQFVKSFKVEIGEKGGLYWHFRDTDDFSQLLRIHINKALSDLVDMNNTTTIVNSTLKKQNQQIVVIEHDKKEELGLFENIELSVSKFEECLISTNNLTGYLNDLTNKFTERTAGLDNLKNSSNDIKVRESKKVSDLIAGDIINFVNRANVEIPIFRSLYNEGFTAYSNAYSIWKTFGTDENEFNNAKQIILNLKDDLTFVKNSAFEFKKIMKSFPNMTTLLSKAKNKIINTLESFMNEYDFAIQLAQDFENN